MTKHAIATLGGGCFWCVEASLLPLRGVFSVVSGYAGGTSPQPAYRDVCNGTTGHAEVVQVSFDPEIISYRSLLEVFFVIHDPTTRNRQGNDVGSQYRSIIFAHDAAQLATAQQLIGELNAAGHWPTGIVTEVIDASDSSSPALQFWPAEDYHQNYFARNPEQGYCQAIIPPKLAKLRKRFFDRLK